MNQAVLFDLDGTLADTAPDLAYALNTLLTEEGYETLPYETIRRVVSHGGAALIKLGFSLSPGDAAFDRLRERLLSIYRENLCSGTTLFPGMAELLESLERQQILWGVVTNKPAWLTEPLMQRLNLSQRASTIVSGDTTGNSKPHPEPLLFACKQIDRNPEHCIYVGDAERDIIAGRRAGMITLAALFGYLLEQDDPASWQAHALIEHPREVLNYLGETRLG